jgi:hypothetical protein
LDESTKIFLHAAELPKLNLDKKVPGVLQALALPARTGFSPYTDAEFGMALSGAA